jgi:folate-dependent phosphoribosylglycinamide formyltransferase PurN
VPSRLDPSHRIVVAGSRSELSYLVINSLATEFDVAHVVFERRRLWRMLRYRVRRLGVPTVAGQLAFMLWDRAVISRRSRKRINQLLRGHDVRPPDGRIPTTDMTSVNDPAFVSLLEGLQPKVVVVTGSGIIAKRVLERGPTFLNIHCGITPRYRGVHGAFWAVVEGHPEDAGTTVHVIDPGVDTGPVVGQERIDVDPVTDTYRSLVVKQHLAGLGLLRTAVASALEGSLRAIEPDPSDSRQWFSPTPADHRRFKKQMRAIASRGR